MLFAGIQKNSTIDFPGVLSAVVFTRGCNLNCFYCHNRTLISSTGDVLDETEIKAFLEKRKGLLDGVVISGGEPTIQPDLHNFIAYCKHLGYKIKLDTNGQKPEMIKELVRQGEIDYFAVDFKSTHKDSSWVCGDTNSGLRVLETIRILQSAHADFEVRTTLYPSLTIENLVSMLSMVPQVPHYRLNYFRMPTVVEDIHNPVWSMDTLKRSDIEKNIEQLLSCQPNLIY